MESLITGTNFPECGEYRFQGNQGFGGKVWAGSRREAPYVTCYTEDDTPERKATRERANTLLKEFTYAQD